MPADLSTFFILLLLAILTSWLLLAWFYRQTLWRLWAEPVLRQPVLIIESDDWGPGPDLHAKRLSALAEMLQSHRDVRGRHPVMTLGVVLAVPDTATLRETGLRHYVRITLEDRRCQAILEAMRRGCDAGVFAVQLHGMEHFWPPALLASAEQDPKLRHWLTCESFPATEDLPSHLQSRWVDASTLPSSPLPQDQIEIAVREEVAQFTRVFGIGPQVAVPPTFVWNATVENAWLEQGIEVIVTPGRQYTHRDSDGSLSGNDHLIRNGQRMGRSGVYLVRDIYFEPAYGHKGERVLEQIKAHYRLGRPALLETHRFNFTGDESLYLRSLNEIKALLGGVLSDLPDVHFMSTAELGRAFRGKDASVIEQGIKHRLHIWLRRLAAVQRLRKLAWLTGFALIAGCLYLVTYAHSPLEVRRA